jgi:hypothetical protein
MHPNTGFHYIQEIPIMSPGRRTVLSDQGLHDFPCSVHGNISMDRTGEIMQTLI